MIKILSFVLFLGLILPAAPVLAQEDDLPESHIFDSGNAGTATEAADTIREMQRRSLGDKGFIKPSTVNVELTQEPFMSGGQFGLRMSVPEVVNGCFAFTPLEYETSFKENGDLLIKVKHYRRLTPQGFHAHELCTGGNKMATALVVLDKKDLEARGTQRIVFSGAGMGTDTYRVALGDTHIELIPQSMMMFHAVNLSGPLKDRIIHPLAANKIVALQVPMAAPGEDLSAEINDFANRHALKPTLGGNPVSWSGNGYASYYFFDESGRTIARIGDKGYAELGKIAVSRPYDGPQGRTEAPVGLSVFVTRPGTQL